VLWRLASERETRGEGGGRERERKREKEKERKRERGSRREKMCVCVWCAYERAHTHVSHTCLTRVSHVSHTCLTRHTHVFDDLFFSSLSLSLFLTHTNTHTHTKAALGRRLISSSRDAGLKPSDPPPSHPHPTPKCSEVIQTFRQRRVPYLGISPGLRSLGSSGSLGR
jgi:hypothetical protein